MKKLIIILMVLIFSLSFLACDSGGGGGGGGSNAEFPVEWHGTWKHDMNANNITITATTLTTVSREYNRIKKDGLIYEISHTSGGGSRAFTAEIISSKLVVAHIAGTTPDFESGTYTKQP